MENANKPVTGSEPSRPSRPLYSGKSNRTVATEIQIRDTIAVVRDALERRRPRQPNIWAFFSNKNNELLTVLGDLTFIQCILFEGDSTVKNYQPGPAGSDTTADEHIGKIEVTWKNGRKEIYRCIANEKWPHKTSHEKKKPGKANSSKRASEFPVIVTERDLARRMVEFANWLLLNGAITRARNFSSAHESELLMAAFSSGNGITFGDAMKLPNADPALILAAIAKGLATGVLECDLKGEFLSTKRSICLSRSHFQPVKRLEDATGPKRAEPQLMTRSMPRNRRTNAHPELFAYPARWLVIDRPELPENGLHRLRAIAVQLYLQNRPYSEIRRETGISATWVRKLFARTFAARHDGSPRGLQALARYCHLEPYVRHSNLPPGNLAEGRHGGYAGALTSLASRFPGELTEMIEGEVLKTRKDLVNNKKKIREARVSWIDLHGRFLEFLREKGLNSDDYPFNTRDEAYSSLVTLCNAILFNKPLRWVETRGGEDAKRRARIGQGLSSLIIPQWLNQICELDYQKEDSAAIVEVSTPKGTTIDVPVPRWWAGAMVEGYSHAIVATSDSFEQQTTEDCLMELIDLAVVAPEPVARLRRFESCPDGRWLPAHFLPEYAGQAWDILKIDRAWAHKSTTGLSSIVATVGCAICFGEARAWYARHLVERTFEKLTQAGPQNLPSTFGTGPKDTKKRDPDQEARKWRFVQDDICDLIKLAARWVTTTGNEGIFSANPLEVIRTAMADTSQRFFPRPFPLPRQKDRPTMWHVVPCKIEGNALKGLAPCVRVNRTRFRGPQLARSWNLIKQNALLQICRREFQISRVLVNQGELVGYVSPEPKWMDIPLSWRDHNLIQKFGRIKRRHERQPTPTHNFLEVKQEEIVAKHSARKNNPKVRKMDAAIVTRILRNAKMQGPLISQASSDHPEQTSPTSPETRAVLGPAPIVGAMTRGKHRD